MLHSWKQRLDRAECPARFERPGAKPGPALTRKIQHLSDSKRGRGHDRLDQSCNNPHGICGVVERPIEIGARCRVLREGPWLAGHDVTVENRHEFPDTSERGTEIDATGALDDVADRRVSRGR